MAVAPDVSAVSQAVCECLEAKCHHHTLPCGRYEEEINRRTAAENDFVLLKKVRAGGSEGGLTHGMGPGALPQG